MVTDSCAEETEYKEIPYRFEAGTPNIAGVIGFGAALDFVTSIGFPTIREHDQTLTGLLIGKLQETFGEHVHILGSPDPMKRAGLVSFTIAGLHPHDIAQVLGEQDICIRAGEHCAAPLHRTLAIPASVRVSLGIYNTETDIDQFIDSLKSIGQLFR
jgi:cysteine desulfurase/selenocysteine lyase